MRLDGSSSGTPTYFGNPFRSFDAGELVAKDPNRGALQMQRPGVECTMFRSDAVDPASSPSSRPLFERTHTLVPSDNHRNTDRNPYFRYSSLQRLGNLTTTRSNVYAIWVTVGYFEAVRKNVPAGEGYAFPDRYMLGKEIGSDTGEVKRHRAFYVVDRTIPVAFEPGVNHNVDDCIILRRRIE